MNRLLTFFALTAFLRADTLEEILKRMDASAKKFQSVSATIKQITYNELLKDTSEGMGEMRLKKTNKGLVGIVDFAPPDKRTYHFNGGTVEIYYPKTNIEEIYDVSKYKGTMERALTLGFGTSGAELQKDYTIKMIGPDKVHGVAASHLELSPKSAEMQKLVTKVELWIQDGESYPVQEKGIQPSKDYTMFVYSDVKINPPLAPSSFEMKVPAGVKRVQPQK